MSRFEAVNWFHIHGMATGKGSRLVPGRSQADLPTAHPPATGRAGPYGSQAEEGWGTLGGGGAEREREREP
jgi:hypothetical protein